MSTADLLIAIKAVDQASATLRQVAQSTSSMGTAARSVGPSFSAMSSAMTAGTLAAHGLMAAARGLVDIFGSMGGAAVDFDQSMASIRSKLSNAEWDQYGEALNKTVLRLGKDYPLSAAEAGKAVDLLIQKGVSAKAVNEGWAESVVKLSSATGSDLVTSASIAAAASDAFGISAEKSGETVNKITGAVLKGGMSIEDYGLAMKAAAGVVALAGGSIDDLNLGLAVMARRGVEGSDAGTSMKTMYMNLIPTTKAQIEVARELGIVTADGTNRFFDATGKVKSYQEITKVLAAATAGLTEQQKLMAFETLFGSDAIRAAAFAAEFGKGEIDELAASLNSVDADEVTKKRMDSLKGSITQFTGSAETLGIVLIGKLAPGFRTLVDTGTELLNTVLEKLDTPEATAFFERLGQGVSKASDLLYTGGQAVSEYGEQFKDAGDAGEVFNAALQTVGSVLTGLAAILRGDAKGAAEAFGTAFSNLGGVIRPLETDAKNVGDRLGELADFLQKVSDKAGQMGAWDNFTKGLLDVASEIQVVKDRLDELGAALGTLNGSVGTSADKVNLLATVVKIVAVAFQLWALSFGGINDSILTFITVTAQMYTVLINLSKGLAALALGDAPAADAAFRKMTIAMVEMGDTAASWADRMAERAAQGFGAISGSADVHIPEAVTQTTGGMHAIAAAVREGAAAQEAAAQAGGTGMVAALEGAAPGMVAAAEAGATGAAAAVEGAAPSMAAAAEGGATGAVAAVQGQAPGMEAAGAALGTGMSAGIEGAAPAMAAAAGGGASGAVAAVQGYEGAASGAGSSVGTALGSGMETGILGFVGRIAAAAANLVRAAIGAANAEAEIHSPSKKTEKSGENLGKGYLKGLESVAPAVREKLEHYLDAAADYVPVAGQIARVEREIKDIRDKAQTDALFRAARMVDVESEMLRLKKDQAVAERDLVAGRQELARASREVTDIERGSLPERQSLIEMDGQRKALRLQTLDLERQLVGLDRDSKRAQSIQAQIDKLNDQDKLLGIEQERIRLTNDIAATGARVRKEGLEENVAAQQRVIDAMKDQLDVLAAEDAVFRANEAVIKNATDNEVAYRERLIAVFQAEGKPLQDRINAGLALVDQLEAEGAISKELADKLRDVAKQATDAKAPVAGLGNAAASAAPQMDAAARKAAEMAAEARAVGSAANDASKKVDALSSSLGKLPEWFRPKVEGLFKPRALGGPVASGGQYLVGELGPELFVPSRSGVILPAGLTSSLLSGDAARAYGGSSAPSASGDGRTDTLVIDVRTSDAEATRIYVTGKELASRLARD